MKPYLNKVSNFLDTDQIIYYVILIQITLLISGVLKIYILFTFFSLFFLLFLRIKISIELILYFFLILSLNIIDFYNTENINSLKNLIMHFSTFITLFFVINLNKNFIYVIIYSVSLFFIFSFLPLIINIINSPDIHNLYGVDVDYFEMYSVNPLFLIERMVLCMLIFFHIYFKKYFIKNIIIIFVMLSFGISFLYIQRTLFFSPIIYLILAFIFIDKKSTFKILFYLMLVILFFSIFIDLNEIISLYYDKTGFDYFKNDPRYLIFFEGISNIKSNSFSGHEINIKNTLSYHNFFLDIFRIGGLVSFLLAFLLILFISIKTFLVSRSDFPLIVSIILLLQTIVFPEGNFLIFFFLILYYILTIKITNQIEHN